MLVFHIGCDYLKEQNNTRKTYKLIFNRHNSFPPKNQKIIGINSGDLQKKTHKRNACHIHVCANVCLPFLLLVFDSF